MRVPVVDALTEPSAPPPSGADSDLPLLVPIEVSTAKLEDELSQWRANEDSYRRRGWLLLGVADLTVDIAFVATLAVGDLQVPAITAAIRLRYDNYDLWAPSLTFINPRTGNPMPPVVRAPDTVDGQVRDVLLAHPNGRPFLCVPGLREYHSHPQHSGDDWLLHRTAGLGRLAVVCDIVWRRMARNVLGVAVTLQSLPNMGTQLNVGIAQGDIDLLQASVPA